ncbi:sigma-70 family RNA polymerase sigma factor [Sphingobacterium composti]|uniref:sigma-70 family RNA polymerase sigma factor n=1 Tax=Sphingobacterium composti TaxID=363260 RepID=UPI003743B821
MYYRQLHFYCNSIIANEDDAQDIVSDVFVIFYDRFKQFDNLKQIKSYLYTSVRNACINYIRHQKVVNEKSVDVDIFIISTRVKFSNFIVTLATATSPD